MSVLLVAVVMLGLAGAFFVSHRSDLALMTSSAYREQTKNACFSVCEFIQYKLENDRTFGKNAFSKNNRLPKPESFPLGSDAPDLTVEYHGDNADPEENVIVGRLPGSKVDFEARILNNLDGETGLELSKDKLTPPRTARVWITSRRGNLQQDVEFILKRSPFTNASITSGHDIDVQLTDAEDGNWWLGARQPSGNAVRASGEIRGPEVWSETGRAVLFEPPPGMDGKAEPPYGVIQGEKLKMQVDGRPTPIVAGEQTTRDSEKNIKGVLSPGGGAVKVPELSNDDLQGPTNRFVMPTSTLIFSTREGPNGPVQVLQNGNRTELASYDPLGNDKYIPENREFKWRDSEGKPYATFDLESRVMTVEPDVELEARSKFSLRSETSDRVLDTAKQPTLFLGTNLSGSAIDAPEIEVEGSVGGQGALKSTKGNLKIAAKSSLSTTPDYGLALSSSADIILTKPGNNAKDGLAVDWDAFGAGYKSGAGNSGINKWHALNDGERVAAAGSFKARKIATSGSHAEFDEIWDGLTRDFPADDFALQKKREWLKPGVAAVTGPDPEWTEATTTTTTTTTTTATTGGSTGAPAVDEAPTVVLTPAIPAGPGVSVADYVRVREYLRTVKAGSPDPTWLESDDETVQVQRSNDVSRLVSNQLSAYQSAAGQKSTEVNGQVILSWNSLGEFFSAGSNPYLANYAPDMTFRGLVYAGQDFIFDTQRKGIYIEGALVAQRDVLIQNATGAKFVYNSELLENLFATNKEDLSVKLERSYWAYY